MRPVVPSVLGEHEILSNSHLALLAENLMCFHILKEKGDIVMSRWYITNCSARVGLLVEHLSGKFTAPWVFPPLLFPTPAFPWWSGYSRHAQERWCVWFSFSRCLLPYSHPCYSISVCTFPFPIPLHHACSASGFITVWRISCCLMPSAAVRFLRRGDLLRCCFFLSRTQSILARPCWLGEDFLQLGSPPQLLYSPRVFSGTSCKFYSTCNGEPQTITAMLFTKFRTEQKIECTSTVTLPMCFVCSCLLTQGELDQITH